MSLARIQYRPIRTGKSALFNKKKNTNHIRYDGKASSKNKHGKLLYEAVTILLFFSPFQPPFLSFAMVLKPNTKLIINNNLRNRQSNVLIAKRKPKIPEHEFEIMGYF